MINERKISDQFDKLSFKIRWIGTENIYSLTNPMQIIQRYFSLQQERDSDKDNKKT
jgi:hypothetical protein